MCSRFCRVVFSFTLGLILLAGLALAVESMASSLERAAESPDRAAARVPGAAAPTSPTAMPTLTLGIAPSDHFPALGSALRYSITLRNTGDAAANAASMSNTLPIGLELVTGTLAATGGAAVYDPISRTIHWQGDLAASGIHTVTYAAVLNTAGYIYNSATISHPLAARPAGAVSSPADYWGDAETLDSMHTFANTLGGYRHIAVDAAGAPHIAYGGNDLFYATPTIGSLQTAEAGAAGWRIETASAANASQAALVLDDQGRALITYASGTSLWLARQASTAPGSAWTTERIVQYTSWTLQNKLDLRRGSDGRLHLAYNRDDELYYTVHDGSVWSAPVVVIPKTACDLAAWGAGFSLALDAANAPHVACVQRGSAPYEVRIYTGTTTAPWTTYQVITSSATSRYAYPSLTYDAATPHLVFVADSRNLWHATTGSGWQLTPVDQPPNTAWAIGTALDIRGGQMAVAYSYYQSSATAYTNTIRLARRPLAAAAWNVETVEAFTYGRTSQNYAYPTLALDGAGQPHLAYYHAPEPTLRYATQAVTYGRDATAPAGENRHVTGVEPSGGLVGAREQPAKASTPGATAPAAFTFQTVDESRELGASAVAVGSDASVHVAYLSDGVRYLLRPPGTHEWVRTLAVPGVDDSYDSELDLALDAANTPHIAYASWGGPLLHAAPSSPPLLQERGLGGEVGATQERGLGGEVATWITRTVDMPGNLMAHPSIGAEAAGTAQIAYLAVEGGAKVLRHAALAGSTWQTATLATVGPAASAQYPQLVAQAGKVYILYFDCAAHQTSGDYPIHLMLKTLTGGAWTTRDLYQWNGRCTDSSGSQLLGSETGRLVAMLYALMEGGRVMLIGDFVIEPGGVIATFETLAVPETAGPAEIRAVWDAVTLSGLTASNALQRETSEESRAAMDASAHTTGLSMTEDGEKRTLTMLFADRAALAAGEAQMGRSPDLAAPLGGGWWYYTDPRQNRGVGIESVEVDSFGNKYVRYQSCAGASGYIPTGTGLKSSQITPNNLGRYGQTYAAVETDGSTIAVEAPSADCCLQTAVAPPKAATEGCTATPAITYARCNSAVQVAAAAKEGSGWRFVEWTGAASGSAATTQALVTGKYPACSVATANFLKQAAIANKIARPSFYADAVAPEEEISYVVSLSWESSDGQPARNNRMSDAIPAYSDYVPGSVWASKGQAIYQGGPDDGVVQWPVGDVEIESGETVQIGFRVKLDYSELPASRLDWPPQIFNTAAGYINGAHGYQKSTATFVFNPIVNTTADTVAGDPHDGKCSQDGAPCSLREALEEVNYHPNRTLPGGVPLLDVVSFNLPTAPGASEVPGASATAAIPVIPIRSALPAVTDPTIIDGNSQGGGLVRIDGQQAGVGVHGLRITAGGSTVRGLALTRFDGSGIVLETGGGNTLQGNLIGADDAGAGALGNHSNGILVRNSASNRIGGNEEAQRNVISGNGGSGVVISGTQATANTIQGNFIGADPDGAARLPNAGHGLLIQDAPGNIIGGAWDGPGANVLSGNDGAGLVIIGAAATGNTVTGNYIGLDAEGDAALYNAGDGVRIVDATSNHIGGSTTASRNAIVGNRGSGIVISGPRAARNVISGNVIGWLTWSLHPIGNDGDGVQVTAAAHDNTIGGNIIVLNRHNGVALSAGATKNAFVGNWIGVDTTDSEPSPNGDWVAAANLLDGVLVDNAPGNIIGAAASTGRNVIAANSSDGIEIRGASAGTTMQGNFIGLLPSGTEAAGNQQYGVFINEAAGNYVGGTGVGAGNIIAANRTAGVAIVGSAAANNHLEGNCLGLDGACDRTVGATQPYGIYLRGAPANIIGGNQAQARNVIANAGVGIALLEPGAADNTVIGNYIGTEKTGAAGRGIKETGIRLERALDNAIGGPAAGEGNLIAGSAGHGIVIMGEVATRNKVQGNRIGVQADGVSPLGHALHGIYLGDSATGNRIGGIETGEGNVIAHNGRDGVFVESGVRNAILGNRIFANQEQGIDLAPGGWNPNDAGDGDDGANKLQNAPMVTTTVSGGGTTVYGVLDSLPGRTYRVEIFANPTYRTYQGEELLGAGDMVTGGDGRGSFQMNLASVRTAVAATVTDPDGNTSEFSVVQIVVNSASDEEDASAGDGACDVNLGAAGEQCTLRAAIQEANRRRGADTIAFNIPGTGSAVPLIRPGRALPAISEPATLDAITQPGSQRVIVDGSNAGSGADGLRLTAGGSSVRGLIIRNFASHYGILLEGARAELQNVALTDNGRGLDAGGAVRLENVNISDNLGTGIFSPLNDLVFDGLDNQISGNGAYGIHGLNVSFRGVEVVGNKCAGILARKNVTISERGTIGNNGTDCVGGVKDGISSDGVVEAHNIESSHNVGSGILARGNIRLENALLNDNGGAGVFSYLLGSITFEGATNQVNRNKANGIIGRNVTARRLEVISNDCIGIRALGKVEIAEAAVISHNGKGVSCAARQGIWADGLVRARNIEVEYNGSTGILADGPVTLENSKLNHNEGAGVAMILRGPLIFSGAYNQVSDNHANGVIAAGAVRVENLDIIHNQCAGIVSVGKLEITGRANISNNGWDAACPSREGIYAAQSSLVQARNLTTVSNGGFGILAGQDVAVTNGRLCSNGKGGILAGRNVTLQGVQVCANQGAGVISGGAYISSMLSSGLLLAVDGGSMIWGSDISDNTAGGIEYVTGAGLTISQGNIRANSGLAINNRATSITVDARGNWWGNAAGPGGAIAGDVDFSGWLIVPVSLVTLPVEEAVFAPIGAPVAAAIYLRNWVAPTDTVRVRFSDAVGWLSAPTVVTVTLADETLGGTAYITVTVPAGTPADAGDVVTATATSLVSPTVTATAVFRVTAARVADLSLDKTDPPDTVMTGEPLVYTLVVSNAGPHAATGVIVTDTLPVSATLISAAPAQGTCSGATAIVCNLGALAAGATTTVTLITMPTASGVFWNTAVATAGELDPNSWNNADATMTNVWIEPRQFYLPLVLRGR